MTKKIADLIDFELSWKRVKNDLLTKGFVRHPYEVRVIERNLTEWLGLIKKELLAGEYSPKPLSICDIPKPYSLIRPGCRFEIKDQFVYTGCVGVCFPYIHKIIGTSTSTDFSYPFAESPNDVEWLKRPREDWQKFKEAIVNKIHSDKINYVVETDIVGFFENIDQQILISDLRQTEAPQEIIDRIYQCFNRWSIIERRGIPQGLSPSHILSKLYMFNIDNNLKALGIKHFRYVDDIRIFCKTKPESKKAIVALNTLLRDRGLGLQQSKTFILTARECIEKTSAVENVMRSVREGFILQAKRLAGLSDDSYITIGQAEQIIDADPDKDEISILSETYRVYFEFPANDNFNKTLFRFVLNRLGRASNGYALDHCFDIFVSHPEEIETVVRYFEALNVAPTIQEKIADYLMSEEMVYPYQAYILIEWLAETKFSPSEKIIDAVRFFAFDKNWPPYLRSVAIRFLDLNGSHADLERIQNSYREASGDSLRQIEIMCAVRRIEDSKRNRFLSGAAKDGVLNSWTEKYIKGLAAEHETGTRVIS